MFGGDFLKFKYDKDYGIKIDESVVVNIFEYSYNYWEKMYGSYNVEENDDQVKIFCYFRCNLVEIIFIKR